MASGYLYPYLCPDKAPGHIPEGGGGGGQEFIALLQSEGLLIRELVSEETVVLRRCGVEKNVWF